MRKWRPEYYSDSSGRTAYELDQPTLEYHLDTLTNRNQTHDFEIFCRKLSERVICPNLRPATGPEGGGDSKADSETFAVADEVSQLYYVGEPNAGSDRWAFAFSANEQWARKVRSDVLGIVNTRRNYDRIICVTSRFARARTRAELEDSLREQYGIPIEIHDRTWIVKEIIDNNRRDIAFNYLGVGRDVANAQRIGPNDYTRSQQLADIEATLADPDRFRGMETQMVTEALISAKLCRGLEHPRPDIEGRFARAKRLAMRNGTHRQQLEVDNEIILTAFWWYDDFELLNASYDDFEETLQPDEHVKNVEFLSDIAQLLVISVIHGHLTIEESKLIERSNRLRQRLREVTQIKDQPNSALEAATLLVLWKLNMALVLGESAQLPAIWSEFVEILERARPMGEYDAERIARLIGIAGQVAGNDPDYNALVEHLAVFVSERRSEAEGARLLVQRAQQLDFDQTFEMIRLLGKAVRKLSKKEYDHELINALKLLALAYRSAGLLWASRATCLMAAARIASEAAEESELRLEMIPILKVWAWLSLELRHLPDLLSAMQLLGGLARALPLADDSENKFGNEWQQFDSVFACLILNSTEEEVGRLEALPDKLDRIQLHFSRMALLYSLGHEKWLREEGSIPKDEEAEETAKLFSTLASQPVSKKMRGPLICNLEEGQTFETRILGLTIRVSCSGSELSILVAEVVVGAVEAFFATTLDLEVMPHTEAFDIEVLERKEVQAPDFRVHADRMQAKLVWPSGKSPADFNFQEVAVRTLMEITGSILATTCFSSEVNTVLKQLYENEVVTDRITMLTLTPNNYCRILGRSFSRLSNHMSPEDETFAMRDRPQLQDLTSDLGNLDKDAATILSHRNAAVRSVIDVHLWDRANWRGAAFFLFRRGGNSLPMIALAFNNREGAEKIFGRWRERFGTRDVDNVIHLAIIQGIPAANPSHYEVLVTSSLLRPTETDRSHAGVTNYTGRQLTVTPDTSTNLDRFLKEYRRVGVYFLAPAILNGTEAEPIRGLAILKNSLSVRSYDEIGPNDLEAMAFPDRFSPSSNNAGIAKN